MKDSWASSLPPAVPPLRRSKTKKVEQNLEGVDPDADEAEQEMGSEPWKRAWRREDPKSMARPIKGRPDTVKAEAVQANPQFSIPSPKL